MFLELSGTSTQHTSAFPQPPHLVSSRSPLQWSHQAHGTITPSGQGPWSWRDSWPRRHELGLRMYWGKVPHWPRFGLPRTLNSTLIPKKKDQHQERGTSHCLPLMQNTLICVRLRHLWSSFSRAMLLMCMKLCVFLYRTSWLLHNYILVGCGSLLPLQNF